MQHLYLSWNGCWSNYNLLVDTFFSWQIIGLGRRSRSPSHNVPDVACVVRVHADNPHPRFEKNTVGAFLVEESDALYGAGRTPFVGAEVVRDGPRKRRGGQSLECNGSETIRDPNVIAPGVPFRAPTGAFV